MNTEDVTIRRIVMGQINGVSTFTAIETSEPAVGGRIGQRYWPVSGSDGPLELPLTGTEEYPRTFFPPQGGYRAHVVEFPAASAGVTETRGEWPEPGLMRGMQYAEPGSLMHRTDSIDIAVVISGEIGLEAGDGEEVLLRPGDIVSQNGADHAWIRKDVPCKLVFVTLGATRVD